MTSIQLKENTIKRMKKLMNKNEIKTEIYTNSNHLDKCKWKCKKVKKVKKTNALAPCLYGKRKKWYSIQYKVTCNLCFIM